MLRTQKMHSIAQEHVTRILQEQKKINHEVEDTKRRLDGFTCELSKHRVLSEDELQKLEKEKQQVSFFCVFALFKASVPFLWQLCRIGVSKNCRGLLKSIQLIFHYLGKCQLADVLMVFQNVGRINSLYMASLELKKAHENVLRITEEQKVTVN